MHSLNEVIVAAAGSGKTERLIDQALADRSKRVLITTYTRENLREIETRLWQKAGAEPHQVTTMSWFEFLLREGVKPYQAYKTDILRVRSINFAVRKASVPGLKFARKDDFDKYYIDANSNLYQEVVSDLVCAIDGASGGKVISRLAACYDLILVDEVQDLAGPDLDLLVRLFESGIRVVAVGDPRQAVYATNMASKNKQHRGAAIAGWIDEQVQLGRVSKIELKESHRCNQQICDFADALYPELPATVSRNAKSVEDGGVHLVHLDDLGTYRETHSPQELRWSRSEANAGLDALNMGEVKGMAFDRVLVHPTSTIRRFVERGDGLAPRTRARFYVAVTRARHSVGIVTERRSTRSALTLWTPSSRN